MSTTPVGRQDGVAVVLDHDHAVALLDQAPHRQEQAFVVARVQSDAGLVEHVEHADQRCADLRGQSDALTLAAGERVSGAIERQVVEADVDQEARALDHGLEQRLGDRGVTPHHGIAGEELGEELLQLSQR